MTKIAVIGGGITGLSAASALAPQAKVTLYETEPQLGYHATGRSATMVIPGYGNTWVCALTELSIPMLTDMLGPMKPMGLMTLCKSGEEAEFEAEIAGTGMVELPIQDALKRVPILNPDTLTRAALDPRAWGLDSDLLLQTLRKSALAQGATIHTKAPVVGLTHTENGWDIEAGDHSGQADVIINAAGPWADETAKMAGLEPLGMQPFRRSMAQIPVPDGFDAEAWPMLLGVGERWYAKPEAGALLVSPADQDPMEPHDAWADDMVLALGIERYQEAVVPEVTRLLSNWAGLRSYAPDRTLVIGPDPRQPSFVWDAGQGGNGFQICLSAAQLVADHALGRTPNHDADLVAALLPNRLI